MANHLQFTKWRDSAFSTEQLRTTRWLLNSKAKNMPEALQEYLTVTGTAQEMLMELHVRTFLNSTRRMKPSSRGKARASIEEFEKMVDYSCIFARLRQVAKEVRSDSSVDDKLMEAFLNKHLGIEWKHLSLLSKPQVFQTRFTHESLPTGTTSLMSKQSWHPATHPFA